MNEDEERLRAFGSAGPAPVFFHGKISREQAEERLMGKPDGTFIIRDSTSSRGHFVMSVAELGKVSHYKIERLQPGLYCIGGENFPDLPAIIEFYKRHLLDSTSLSVPLPLDRQWEGGKLIETFLHEARALYNFNAKDPEDLSFRKGEMLNILEKHEKEWWRAQSQWTLQIGCIPANYVEPIIKQPAAPEPPPPRTGPSKFARTESVMRPEPTPPPPNPPPPRAAAPPIAVPPPAPLPPRAPIQPSNIAREAVIPQSFLEKKREELPDRPKFVVAKAIMDRVASAYDPSALSFKTGDIVHVMQQNKNGLWMGCIVGKAEKVGHFPFTLVELIDSSAYDDELAEFERVFNVQMDEIYGTTH